MSIVERPRVRWLHGYTMNSSLWSGIWSLLPQFDHLGGDLPGHGVNPEGFGGRGLADVAEQLADELVAAGCRHLVGLSFGSMIALQVAISRPEVLDSLVLAAPTLAGPDSDAASALKYFQLTMAARLGAGPIQLADLWMAGPPDIFTGVNRDPVVREQVAAVVRRHRWTELGDGSMTGLRTGAVHDAPALGRIRAATTVVVGTQDMPAFLRNAEVVTAAVPTSRLVTVDGLGHLPLLERPDLTAPVIAAAVAEAGSRRFDDAVS